MTRPPLPSFWEEFGHGPDAWVRQAACATTIGDWFPNPAVDASAERAVCARCPVRQECLAYALDAGEPHGIWGGHTTAERAASSAGSVAGLQHDQPNRVRAA